MPYLEDLADEAEAKETMSLRQTTKAIRSHGHDAVEAVDITCLARGKAAIAPALRVPEGDLDSQGYSLFIYSNLH